MKEMRYGAVVAMALAAACWAEGAASIAVRGTLALKEGKPGVETAPGKFVFLDGDEPTRATLHDSRLAGADLEARGHFTGPDRFQVDPVHLRPLSVYKDGKARLVTYWCATCGIRTWMPGKCWCCQEETALDLLDPETLPQ
jgi:hypothetical protein